MPEIKLDKQDQPDPNEWFGKVHILIVRELGEPESDGLRPITDYEVEHPGCAVEQRGRYGRAVVDEVYTCDIGWMLDQDGDLAFSLKYSGTPVTEPGTYRIQGWGRKTYYWEYGAYEYDNGIGVVTDEDTAGDPGVAGSEQPPA